MPGIGKLPFLAASLFIFLILTSLFLMILKINHGVFTYTLDDLYIHPVSQP